MTNLYIRKSQPETVVIDDETMILHPNRFTITKVNHVGSYCWSLLEKPHSEATLSEAVRQHYNTTDPNVEQDIRDFLDALLECELIEPVR